MKNLPAKKIKSRGFTLIITISLLALLTVIGIGLLNLSAVTMRGGSKEQARAIAQSNARMALMIAIGELQKQMGPDQRVSANGAIVSTTTVSNPHWTGIWNSWKAGAGENSQHSTIGNQPDSAMRPIYDTSPGRPSYFRSWLLSLTPTEAASVTTARDLVLNGASSPGKDSTAVQLVGKGSLGLTSNPAEYVNARLLTVNQSTSRSRYGWWVGDESQKARVMDNSYQAKNPANLAERLNRQQAPASYGNSEIRGLENVANESALSFMPTRETLGLVDGATKQVTEQFHDITTSSLGVLSDVREGGLKRDLSTILERTIDPDEVYNFAPVADFRRAQSLKPYGEDFLLYNFDSMITNAFSNRTGQGTVPIQDLAAYYQLYNRYRSGSMGGIQYSSSESSPANNYLSNGIMVSNPDYGVTGTDLDKYLRQYTGLYRNPVMVKLEIILSYISEVRTPAEIAAGLLANPPIPATDTHNLRLGISPAVTFWNPNNVSLVMNIANPDLYSYRFRETPIPLRFQFTKSDTPSGPATGTIAVDFNKTTNTQQGELYTLYVSGNYPAVFEPGESKVFALRFASNTSAGTATNDVDFLNRAQNLAENFMPNCELVPGWNPEKFIRPIKGGRAGTGVQNILTFKATDYISATMNVAGYNTFALNTTQQSRTKRNLPATRYHFQNHGILSRYNADAAYRNSIVYQGFPLNGAPVISNATPRTVTIPQKSAQTLINAMRSPFNPRDDLPAPFFYYGIKAATETHESNHVAGVDGSGRRFPSRPFVHSTAMAPTILDNTDSASLYNYGWNWFFLPVDNLNDVPVEISLGNSGYYGGGHTAENGVTHAVQQQLPLTPPISIATLSHAHLGGFSLATEANTDGFAGLGNQNSDRFRRTTAAGWDGLAPHTLQAIGNSYAHPNIPADKAVTLWARRFDQNTPIVQEPFVDHSYLANKALWDEFFFSSISPKPASVKVFTQVKTVEEVAKEFFFDEKPLPNPRIVPYLTDFSEYQLDELLTDYNAYKDGFADTIAAHLMVEGPFNINSTSVAAWKALFSSLKGQDVTYLDAKSALVVGTNLDFDKIDGVPLPGGSLPNGKAYQGSSSDPSDRDQWTGFRELSDAEIDELATAMVKQVKLRGPFLSLSDFVNRRLDARASEKDRALKGALQAALDDPNVSINEGFRDDLRKFTTREKSFVNAQFPEAMEGPVAYGSAAYVDQADILRNFPEQLTPRGDTFVIRSYGDALDANGNVLSRAWCEAVVQRLPEYINSADEPEVRQADLTSVTNQNFGRKLTIIQFRWLNHTEV